MRIALEGNITEKYTQKCKRNSIKTNPLHKQLFYRGGYFGRGFLILWLNVCKRHSENIKVKNPPKRNSSCKGAYFKRDFLIMLTIVCE